MADEASGIQNKWLLIIAIALGVIVVVIYNAHVKAIKAAQESDMVDVVRVIEDLKVGDRVTADSIEMASVPKEAVKAFGDVVLWKNRTQILRDAGYNIKRPVDKNNLLLWTDVSGTAGQGVDIAPEGTVKMTLNIESNQSPGEVLKVGDNIDLWGIFSPAGGSLDHYCAISGIPVVAIGGAGPVEDEADRRGRSNRAMRSYRRITIAVPRDIAKQLANLETHLIGEWRVFVLRSGDPLPIDAGQISPELKELAKTAKPAMK